MSPLMTMALARLRVLPSSCKVPPLSVRIPVPSGPLPSTAALTVVLAPMRRVPALRVAPPEKSLSGTLIITNPEPFLVRVGIVVPVRLAPVLPTPVVTLLRVTLLPSMESMVEPAWMPVPATVMPTVRLLVSETLWMTLDVPSTSPVMPETVLLLILSPAPLAWPKV